MRLRRAHGVLLATYSFHANENCGLPDERSVKCTLWILQARCEIEAAMRVAFLVLITGAALAVQAGAADQGQGPGANSLPMGANPVPVDVTSNALIDSIPIGGNPNPIGWTSTALAGGLPMGSNPDP